MSVVSEKPFQESMNQPRKRAATHQAAQYENKFGEKTPMIVEWAVSEPGGIV